MSGSPLLLQEMEQTQCMSSHSVSTTLVHEFCQEHRLRLLISLCRPPNRLGSRRLWDDFHYRERQRNCGPNYLRKGSLAYSTPQVCAAIQEVAKRLVGKDTESLFADMGKTWEYMMADPQLRW